MTVYERRFLTDDQRFDTLHLRPADGCWLWLGGISSTTGYGVFWVMGRSVSAHRYAYTRAHGEVPNGLHVLHRCDVRACVRPDHLFAGTNADNVADMRSKGRQRYTGPAHPCRGEEVHTAKVCADDVRAIRAAVLGYGDAKRLAAEYGITVANLWAIRTRKTWRHIG